MLGKFPVPAETFGGMQHGFLADYPYDEQSAKYYVIHRRKQYKKLWSKVKQPHRRIRNLNRRQICWQALLWLGWVFSVICLIMSFVKEDFLEKGLEQGKNLHEVESSVLLYTLVELTFAMGAVLVCMSKNYNSYSRVMKLQKSHITTIEAGYISQKVSRNKRRLVFCSIGIWTVGMAIMVGGFVLLYLLDKDLHTKLVYTRYTTVVTIFIALILDEFLSDLSNEASNRLKLDQCKLVIHQLKVELMYHLEKSGQKERAESLENYLDARKLFALPENGHILEVSVAQRHVEEGNVAEQKHLISPEKAGSPTDQNNGSLFQNGYISLNEDSCSILMECVADQIVEDKEPVIFASSEDKSELTGFVEDAAQTKDELSPSENSPM